MRGYLLPVRELDEPSLATPSNCAGFAPTSVTPAQRHVRNMPLIMSYAVLPPKNAAGAPRPVGKWPERLPKKAPDE